MMEYCGGLRVEEVLLIVKGNILFLVRNLPTQDITHNAHVVGRV